jgi:hypothetical protein
LVSRSFLSALRVSFATFAVKSFLLATVQLEIPSADLASNYQITQLPNYPMPLVRPSRKRQQRNIPRLLDRA